jgi:hypothetical protein
MTAASAPFFLGQLLKPAAPYPIWPYYHHFPLVTFYRMLKQIKRQAGSSRVEARRNVEFW